MRGIDINVSIVYQNLPSKYILLISRSANIGPLTIIKKILPFIKYGTIVNSQVCRRVCDLYDFNKWVQTF